ncbi:hypothetical protein DICPUDRAFT_76386 [Dictyostelium purpureum]|uniref:Uncharacterized protein n=1 Tax=Dictyostelium purpureum TaxID=5786 RepID=F0ZDG3_DICPU|nr:uncharacterized protein DICPUDRAFT_76386 [Dictyostelium purpureum]EGC38041.1 hypothetical protein DICPUDRAFT_76386 [Dictyostelium purpureum]|eukprot:XP_003285442.1 hypothetical protein DICPUDRAFT_76386 [Dictyostelium purpureum]
MEYYLLIVVLCVVFICLYSYYKFYLNTNGNTNNCTNKDDSCKSKTHNSYSLNQNNNNWAQSHHQSQYSTPNNQNNNRASQYNNNISATQNNYTWAPSHNQSQHSSQNNWASQYNTDSQESYRAQPNN